MRKWFWMMVVVGVASWYLWPNNEVASPFLTLEDETAVVAEEENNSAPLFVRADLRVAGVDVTVDYNKTFEQAIAAGKYSEVDPRVNAKNYPTNKKGTDVVEIEVLQVARDAGLGVLKNELAKLGYRSVTIYEIMAFRAEYLEWQHQNAVLLFTGAKGTGSMSLYPWFIAKSGVAKLGVSEATDNATVRGGTLVFAVEE